MAYVKQTWVDGPSGATPLSAARLNYVENGLFAAAAAADAAAGTSVGASGTVPVSNGSNVVYTQLQSQNVGITTFEVTAGGAYTLVLADLGKLKGSLSADTGALTWTVPTNATTAFPLGSTVKVLQRGTGQITVAGATGVTFVLAGSGPKTSQQGGTILLTKLFTDIWLLEGGVS